MFHSLNLRLGNPQNNDIDHFLPSFQNNYIIYGLVAKNSKNTDVSISVFLDSENPAGQPFQRPAISDLPVFGSWPFSCDQGPVL